MGRILAIDYGLKRTGLAATDPLKIIASPLSTVPSATLLQFVTEYVGDNEVETIVVGMPVDTRGADTDVTAHVRGIVRRLRKSLPAIPVVEHDERYTSIMAKRAMLEGGLSKKKRRSKSTVDKISATLILQSYLARRS